jgi:hypothetical protein
MSAATMPAAPVAVPPLTFTQQPSARGGVVANVIVATIAAGLAVLVAWFYLPGLLADQSLGSEGRQVHNASIEGECETYKAFFTLCDGEVAYMSPGGKRMTRSFYMMLVGDIDDSRRLIVRVDPADPSVISMSWGVDALTNRWLTFAGVYALLALFVWATVKDGRRKRQRAESLIAAAAAPRPVAVEVQKQQKGLWRIREAGNSRAKWQVEHLPRRAKPLLLPNGRGLALRGTEGHVHLLTESGWPFALKPVERERLIAAASAA